MSDSNFLKLWCLLASGGYDILVSARWKISTGYSKSDFVDISALKSLYIHTCVEKREFKSHLPYFRE